MCFRLAGRNLRSSFQRDVKKAFPLSCLPPGRIAQYFCHCHVTEKKMKADISSSGAYFIQVHNSCRVYEAEDTEICLKIRSEKPRFLYLYVLFNFPSNIGLVLRSSARPLPFQLEVTGIQKKLYCFLRYYS